MGIVSDVSLQLQLSLKYQFDTPPPHELCKTVLIVFSPILSHTLKNIFHL